MAQPKPEGTRGTEDRVDVIGRRVAAALLDIALLAIALVVVGLIFGETETRGSQTRLFLGTFGSLLWAGLSLSYYFGFEASDGRTLGKRLLGLRVVGIDGARQGVGAIGVRTILRVIDALPVLYLVGLLVTLVTSRRQRLGDLAARTQVVRG